MRKRVLLFDLRRLVSMYFFLLSGRRFNRFDLCKYTVVHIVQNDSRTIVFLQSSQLHIFKSNTIGMTDVEAPSR